MDNLSKTLQDQGLAVAIVGNFTDTGSFMPNTLPSDCGVADSTIRKLMVPPEAKKRKIGFKREDES